VLAACNRLLIGLRHVISACWRESSWKPWKPTSDYALALLLSAGLLPRLS